MCLNDIQYRKEFLMPPVIGKIIFKFKMYFLKIMWTSPIPCAV